MQTRAKCTKCKCNEMQTRAKCKNSECSLECTIMRSDAMICAICNIMQKCKKCAWAKTTRIFGQEPHLCPPLLAFAGDGITNLVLSSVFLPLLPVCRPRPALAGRGAPSHRRRPGELMSPQKVAPARGSAVGSAASGDDEAVGSRLYRLVWSFQCGCVLY